MRYIFSIVLLFAVSAANRLHGTLFRNLRVPRHLRQYELGLSRQNPLLVTFSQV